MMTSGYSPGKRKRDSATAMDAKHKHPGLNPSSNSSSSTVEWLEDPPGQLLGPIPPPHPGEAKLVPDEGV